MSDIHIISARVFEMLKQRARKLKQAEGIPHHEALEKVARALKFDNWHQVVLAAQATQPAENAHRSGLIIALEIKNALDSKFDHDGVFQEDQRLFAFCERELFEDYKLTENDEGSTFGSYLSEEELAEDFEFFMDGLMLYRYAGAALPATLESALALSRERCFFAPEYVWLKGKFINVFNTLSVDGVMSW